MTVFDEGYDDGGEGGPSSNQEHAWKRKQEQARKAAERERDQAKREAAFLRAGIDPEAPGIASYFVKGYEGDLDPSKIRAAATEAGIIQPPPPSPQDVRDQQTLAASQRVSGFSQDATAAPTVQEANRAALEEAYRTGGMEALLNAAAATGVPIAEN
jgi:hypothetical protein